MITRTDFVPPLEINGRAGTVPDAAPRISIRVPKLSATESLNSPEAFR